MLQHIYIYIKLNLSLFVKFFQLSEKFGALQKGQGDVSAPPPTSYHVKLNAIYQIDSRAVGCQILLKKMWWKYSYKMLQIVSHPRNKGKCMRPSNESIQLYKSVEVLEKRSRKKKTGYDENDTKRKGTGEMIELRRKRMPCQCSSILVIRSLILEDQLWSHFTLLEPIIQDEVQKEKDKYHILMYIYMESRKMVLMNLSVGQQWRGSHREQACGHRGQKRVGQMERVAPKHIHYMCKIT